MSNQTEPTVAEIIAPPPVPPRPKPEPKPAPKPARAARVTGGAKPSRTAKRAGKPIGNGAQKAKAKVETKPAPKAAVKTVPFREDQQIRFLLKINAKKEGSKVHKVHELFRTCKTVGEFRRKAKAAGLVGKGKEGYGYLKYAVKDGVISVK